MTNMTAKYHLIIIISVLSLFLSSCNVMEDLTELSGPEWKAVTNHSDIAVNIRPMDLSEIVRDMPDREGIVTLTRRFRYFPEGENSLSALYLGRISFADEVYLNGALVGRTGRFPPDWYNDWNKDRFYKIPNVLFDPSGEQELTIRIYVNRDGLVWGKWYIGREDRVSLYYNFKKFFNTDINLLVAIMFIVFGVHNLIIFGKRRKEKEFLWLGLLTVLFAFNHISLIISTLPFFSYRLFSTLATMKLTALLELLVAISALNFLNAYLHTTLNRKLRTVSISIPLVLLVAAFLQEGYGAFKMMLGVFEFSLILPAVIFLIFINRRKDSRRKNLKNVGYAAVPALLSLIHDLTLPHILESYPVFIAGFGFSLFLIILNIYLVLEFVNDRSRVELLNKNLEAEIQTRSRELLAADDKVAAASRMEIFVGSYDLSRREKEILFLILDGSTNEEIAEKLSIAHKTVSAHLYNIYRKLNVHSRVEIFGLYSS